MQRPEAFETGQHHAQQSRKNDQSDGLEGSQIAPDLYQDIQFEQRDENENQKQPAHDAST
jgi:hypothetical protein